VGRPQRHVYHVEPARFPPDFAERLERLRLETGLSRRALARALRVEARTLRRWRRGRKPGPGHLYRLFCFAVERGLLHCLLPDAAGACTQLEERRPTSPRGAERAGSFSTGEDS